MNLNDTHIGQYVRLQTTTRLADGTVVNGAAAGIYQGVRPSEWDGQSMHMFTDGDINGTAQSTFGFRVAASDPDGVTRSHEVVDCG